jgi:isopentenyl-diphosphate delta-isomerase
MHQALPEIDFNEIDLSTEVFGKRLRIPIMISPLTGGIDSTEKINIDLAHVAQISQIAMGVGSQRIAVENPQSYRTFQVRKYAPDILLFANLGAVQLNYGFGPEQCRQAIEKISADGLMLHVNSLHEAFQHEGNHNFKDLLSKINEVCESINYPTVVREVGFGISQETAENLLDAKVNGIDTGGAGGTSWIEIEKLRSGSQIVKKVAESFLDWGIPTAESIVLIKKAILKKGRTGICTIASGGIKNGVDVAVAIALGADIAGIALPILKKINISIKACVDYIREIEFGLRVVMFSIGARNIAELKNTKFIEKNLR